MDQQCLWKHKSRSQAETAMEVTHAAGPSWEAAQLCCLIASQYAEADRAICGHGNFILRPSHQKYCLHLWLESGSASNTLFSRCQAMMATWLSCTVQILERNWVVVVDHGLTVRWRKTRRDPLWSCVMLLCGPLQYLVILIFTARCYASAVLAMTLCLSVRPSVCLSVRHKSVFY